MGAVGSLFSKTEKIAPFQSVFDRQDEQLAPGEISGISDEANSRTPSDCLSPKGPADEEVNNLPSPEQCKYDPNKMNVSKSIQKNPSNPTFSVISKSSKWSKGELIGRGQFGAVYRGLNLDTGEVVAMKHIHFHNETAKAQEQVEAIENEIGILQKLRKHRNIVSYLGTERQGLDLYILMEYVPGGSIASQIKAHGPLPEPLTRKWTYDIVLGLKHIHDNGFVHRDIKGANILVTSDGSIKLADFGCAKRGQGKSEGFLSVKGTPFWMAPEVVSTKGHGSAADIWSLGATICEMLNGQTPWIDLTQMGVLLALARGEAVPPVPNHISDYGRDFILKCMDYDPSKRPNCQALLDHLWISTLTNDEKIKNYVMEQPLSSNKVEKNRTKQNVVNKEQNSNAEVRNNGKLKFYVKKDKNNLDEAADKRKPVPSNRPLRKNSRSGSRTKSKFTGVCSAPEMNSTWKDMDTNASFNPEVSNQRKTSTSRNISSSSEEQIDLLTENLNLVTTNPLAPLYRSPTKEIEKTKRVSPQSVPEDTKSVNIKIQEDRKGKSRNFRRIASDSLLERTSNALDD